MKVISPVGKFCHKNNTLDEKGSLMKLCVSTWFYKALSDDNIMPQSAKEQMRQRLAAKAAQLFVLCACVSVFYLF